MKTNKGGFLGLFIGASVYTIFEILVLALNSLGVCLKSDYNKKIEIEHGVERSETSNRIDQLEKEIKVVQDDMLVTTKMVQKHDDMLEMLNIQIQEIVKKK